MIQSYHDIRVYIFRHKIADIFNGTLTVQRERASRVICSWLYHSCGKESFFINDCEFVTEMDSKIIMYIRPQKEISLTNPSRSPPPRHEARDL